MDLQRLVVLLWTRAKVDVVAIAGFPPPMAMKLESWKILYNKFHIVDVNVIYYISIWSNL
jgi:hypothetical protein